jgi:hypothetical protein
MAAKQDNHEEMEDITDDVEQHDGIEAFLETMEVVDSGKVINNMTARRRIEELLEERRLRELIEDYRDWDS